MLKILLIIWVVNFVIRIFIKNYLSNDIQANFKYQLGYVNFSSVAYVLSSILNYILGLAIVIMIIIKIF